MQDLKESDGHPKLKCRRFDILEMQKTIILYLICFQKPGLSVRNLLLFCFFYCFLLFWFCRGRCLSHIYHPSVLPLLLLVTHLSGGPDAALHGQWRSSRISLRNMPTFRSVQPRLLITYRQIQFWAPTDCLGLPGGPIGMLRLFPRRCDAVREGASSLLVDAATETQIAAGMIHWAAFKSSKNKAAITENVWSDGNAQSVVTTIKMTACVVSSLHRKDVEKDENMGNLKIKFVSFHQNDPIY